FHKVALAHPNETAWHFAAERPEQVFHAVGELANDLLYFERNDYFGSVFALDGRRHVGRLREHGLLRTYNVFLDGECICGCESQQSDAENRRTRTTYSFNSHDLFCPGEDSAAHPFLP